MKKYKSDHVIQIIDDEALENTLVSNQEHASAWSILIVDDDQIVHDSTEFALQKETIFGRTLVLHHAYSAREAKERIMSGVEYAAALIDVVMETDDAGLVLIQEIRDMGYNEVRIILRTGQPGYAPELSVITDYDITAYRTKTELTKAKLLSVLITSIRSFQQIKTINQARKGLKLIVDASSDLFRQRNLYMLGNGILEQITSLLGKSTNGLVGIAENKPNASIEDYTIICGNGIFSEYHNQSLAEVDNRLLSELFGQSLAKDFVVRETGSIAMHFKSYEGKSAFIFINCGFELSHDNISLLKVFGSNILVSINNLNLLNKLDSMAYTDSLSGVPNMNAVEREITSLMQTNEFVLILIHIHELGTIYSHLGAENFNRFFYEVYSLITERIPDAKIIGQSSWGDFAILLPKDDYHRSDIEALTTLGIDTESTTMQLATTIAVAQSIPADQSAENIIQRANIVRIIAKAHYRGKLLEYDDTFASQLKKRINIQYHMQESVKNDFASFEVYLQPKYDTLINKVVGAEALSRWKLDGEYISPAVFIPIMEEGGFTHELTDRILKVISAWKMKREEENRQIVPVGVNLSMKDILNGEYAEHLLEMCSTYKLTPESLEFEITEGFMMHDVKRAIEQLTHLNSAGYNISIDDFGTGYSSLSYLENLPINIIKIDRAFVTMLTPQNARSSIAATILAMSEKLGKDVVAEGVETTEHLLSLQFLGCNICQGFLFGKPTNIDTFAAAYIDQYT